MDRGDDAAEEFKTQGNELYKKGDYQGAIDMYTQAIEAAPTVVAYYGNRAAAAFMLAKYKEVIVDCNRALVFDPTFFKGYVRKAKAQLALVCIHGDMGHLPSIFCLSSMVGIGRERCRGQDAAGGSDSRSEQPNAAHGEAPG